MSDPDRMVHLGDLATLANGAVPVHRDYEDLVVGYHRLSPGNVAKLEGIIVTWKRQAGEYLRRMDESCAADDDLDEPERCARHGGEGDERPSCPECAGEDERRRECGEILPCDPEWSDR